LEDLVRSVPSRRLKILFFLAEYGVASGKELRTLTHTTREEFEKLIKPLIEMGYVERIDVRGKRINWRRRFPRKPEEIFQLTPEGWSVYEAICGLKRLAKVSLEKNKRFKRFLEHRKARRWVYG